MVMVFASLLLLEDHTLEKLVAMSNIFSMFTDAKFYKVTCHIANIYISFKFFNKNKQMKRL